MRIAYLTYKEIDKQKWDSCINKSLNRLIYAKSFYLDAMAENWDALILDDYEAVMPLTWKKKWGIAYLYQPAFIQQGGIFFKNTLPDETLRSFTEKAFSYFKFAETTFNYLNNITSYKNIAVTSRNNFVLPLNAPYQNTYDLFPSSITKNIKRAKNANLQFHFSTDYLTILKLYKKLYGEKQPFIQQSDYLQFSKICNKLSDENNLVVRKVTNNENELLAAVIILIDGKRLYNLISCVTEKGRLKRANYFLYNELIKEFSNTSFLLDFEGSDVPGIAAFYARFQTTNEPYPFIKFNNLHPLIRIFKQ